MIYRREEIGVGGRVCIFFSRLGVEQACDLSRLMFIVGET